MTSVTVSRTIRAPASTVFAAITTFEKLPDIVPDVTAVEVLTDHPTGLGSRIRETRLVGGKTDVTELEVTEFEENERIRMVADSHGTIWDSVFTVRDRAGEIECR